MIKRALYTQEQSISLLIIASAVFFFYYFPVSGESILQTILVLLAFLVLFPNLYVRFVLKRDAKKMSVSLPHATPRLLFGFFAISIGGILALTLLFFLPYADSYSQSLAEIAGSFKAFALYQIFFVLPSIALGVYFSHVFIEALELPEGLVLTLKIVVMSAITISLLQLPLIAIVFFTVIYGVAWLVKLTNFYALVLGIYIPLLLFDALLTKSLLS